MNKSSTSSRHWTGVAILFLAVSSLWISGCAPVLSSDAEIRRFNKAGPLTPEVDVDSLLRAKMHTGYYRVVPGDLLELETPPVLRVISADISQWFGPRQNRPYMEPYAYRVNDDGTITLPIIGRIKVAGKRVTQIESMIVQAYYPKYVQNLPSVVCAVKEFQTENVTIIGGVVNPGIYGLNSDEMSLVAAIMKSGGILEDGAGVITIRHSDSLDVNLLPEENLEDPNGMLETGESDAKTARRKALVLPVKDLNIPFADVQLYDGDIVEVGKLNPEVFTVLGVVNKPGAFPYPPDAEYTIASALAFAGGPNLSLGPNYVTIYRQDADGEVVSARFGIDNESMARAASVKIKPGDVISVDETIVTRTRMVMKEMLTIRFVYDVADSFD